MDVQRIAERTLRELNLKHDVEVLVVTGGLMPGESNLRIRCERCGPNSIPVEIPIHGTMLDRARALELAIREHIHAEPRSAREAADRLTPEVERRLEALEPQRAPITDVERELNDPDLAKLDNWFRYHAPTTDQVGAYAQIRDGAYMLARCILLHCPPSADRTSALRKLRECVMTANASIACGGK